MRRILHLLMVVPLLTLAACNPPVVTRSKPISFAQYQPIALNVGSIQIVEEYHSPGHAPNVEQMFRTTPAEAMRQWVKDRIRARGGTRVLQVIIKDASVMQEDLPRTGGYQGVFTKDQSERYNARLEVEMRIYGEQGAMSEASISAVATRSDTAGEDYSAAKRDALFDRMLRDLMGLMNAELERNIQQYFANYIAYTPDM